MMMMKVVPILGNILVKDLTRGASHSLAPVGGVNAILLKHSYLHISL